MTCWCCIADAVLQWLVPRAQRAAFAQRYPQYAQQVGFYRTTQVPYGHGHAYQMGPYGPPPPGMYLRGKSGRWEMLIHDSIPRARLRACVHAARTEQGRPRSKQAVCTSCWATAKCWTWCAGWRAKSACKGFQSVRKVMRSPESGPWVTSQHRFLQRGMLLRKCQRLNTNGKYEA